MYVCVCIYIYVCILGGVGADSKCTIKIMSSKIDSNEILMFTKLVSITINDIYDAILRVACVCSNISPFLLCLLNNLYM